MHSVISVCAGTPWNHVAAQRTIENAAGQRREALQSNVPTLSLVYNPVGPSLPPSQQKLEQSYRDQLRQRFGIEFNHLYTITNMPVSRFLDDLLQTGRYDEYMTLLVNSFNRNSVEGLMCRSTVSIDWQGNLFDCDFNQMLNLPLSDSLPRHISHVRTGDLENRPIAVGRHCYGCTAGVGSSCTGSLVTDEPSITDLSVWHSS